VAAGNDEKQRKVEFVFTRSPDYRTIAANGVYGCITPRGDLHARLFVESAAAPEATHMVPEEDGTAGPETPVAPQKDEAVRAVYEREVQIGILMSPAAARLIGNWLLQRYEEWERHRGDFERGGEGEQDEHSIAD
jgi:hypothetical protein